MEITEILRLVVFVTTFIAMGASAWVTTYNNTRAVSKPVPHIAMKAQKK